jgi:WD40 repeat protein
MYRNIGVNVLACAVLSLFLVRSRAQEPGNVPEAPLQQTLSNIRHSTELHFADANKLLVLSHVSSKNEPVLSAYRIVKVVSKNPMNPERHEVIELYHALVGSDLFGKAELESERNGAHQSFRIQGLRLTLSADGRTLATSSLHQVRMWDVAKGKQIGAGAEQDGSVLAAFNTDGKRLLTMSVIGATKQHRLCLWDATSFEPIGEAAARPASGTNGFHARMKGLLWSPDDKSFLSAHSSGAVGEANFIQFWDAATLKPSGERLPALGDFHQFSPDGKTLIVISKKEMTLWDVSNRKLISRLSTPEIAKRWITSDQYRAANMERWFAVHPGGTSVLYAQGDQVHLWDLTAETPQKKQVLQHSADVYWVEISRDGKQAATLDGKQVRIWNIETGRQVLKIPVNDLQDGKIKSMKFSPDGRLLATVNKNDVQLWSLQIGK